MNRRVVTQGEAVELERLLQLSLGGGHGLGLGPQVLLGKGLLRVRCASGSGSVAASDFETCLAENNLGVERGEGEGKDEGAAAAATAAAASAGAGQAQAVENALPPCLPPFWPFYPCFGALGLDDTLSQSPLPWRSQ